MTTLPTHITLHPDGYLVRVQRGSKTARVLDEIAQERDRQRALLREGHITHDCADPAVSLDRKLRTATEELGEIAQGIDLIDRAEISPNTEGREFCIKLLRAQLREECIQLAAVATAIAESLTED